MSLPRALTPTANNGIAPTFPTLASSKGNVSSFMTPSGNESGSFAYIKKLVNVMTVSELKILVDPENGRQSINRIENTAAIQRAMLIGWVNVILRILFKDF